jgi:predicted  nucleic acid-binding Zn-ribbon protein
MDKERLKKEVFTLRQEISDLNCTIQQHEDDLEVLRSKASRMAAIHDLVSQRTHRGKEEEIEKKLNTWFNGVYS